MSKFAFRSFACIAAMVALSAALPAQDIVKEGLASFPFDSIRLEYSSVAKLRNLPDYATLHQHYLAPNLRTLEKNLATLGVHESDINEIVLAWQTTSGGMMMEGLASGQLDPDSIARNASADGIVATPVGTAYAYCFGGSDTAPCVAVLGRALGAFGTLEALNAMVDARSGAMPALGSNTTFANLVERERKDLPIWGVAVGSAIEDWFKSSMPVQKNLPIDLGTVFKNVESLAYSVDPEEQVQMSMELNCTSAAVAAGLRQQFDALRLFQRVAWQRQYPNVPNPFDSLTVGANNATMTLSLSTPYSAIEAAAQQQ